MLASWNQCAQLDGRRETNRPKRDDDEGENEGENKVKRTDKKQEIASEKQIDRREIMKLNIKWPKNETRQVGDKITKINKIKKVEKRTLMSTNSAAGFLAAVAIVQIAQIVSATLVVHHPDASNEIPDQQASVKSGSYSRGEFQTHYATDYN